MTTAALYAPTVSLHGDAYGSDLERVLLAPWGNVESDTGDFVLDDAAAESILQAYANHAVDLVIDYDHQTLGGEHPRPDGLAPASGWIKQLEAVPGVGLFGLVDWTANGRRTINAGEYRYLSPVVMVRVADARAVALHSAALTNRPAIAAMPRLR